MYGGAIYVHFAIRLVLWEQASTSSSRSLIYVYIVVSTDMFTTLYILVSYTQNSAEPASLGCVIVPDRSNETFICTNIQLIM